MKHSSQPAFPVPVAANEVGIYSSFDANGGENLTGLTKREYFAAKAMQGFLAFPGEMAIDEVVEKSVRLADKVLAELEK